MLLSILLLTTVTLKNASGKELAYEASPPSPSPAGPLLVSRPPRLARVPNSGIFYAPDVRYHLFLADQKWYLYYEEKWYQSRSHEGPWRYVSFSKVPEVLKKLPPEFTKRGEPPPAAKKKPVRKKVHAKKSTGHR